MLIDESHNLRNREGKVYRAIYEYVNQSESKCILLTATPYNKTYLDRSNQLRLFVVEDKDLERLESCGPACLWSVERHILRNFIFLQAIENDLPLPIGTQDSGMLDTRIPDADHDMFADDDNDDESNGSEQITQPLRTEADFRSRADELYSQYAGPWRKRFKWLRPSLFLPQLQADLQSDAKKLIGILKKCGTWDSAQDAKLDALEDLLVRQQFPAKASRHTDNGGGACCRASERAKGG